MIDLKLAQAVTVPDKCRLKAVYRTKAPWGPENVAVHIADVTIKYRPGEVLDVVALEHWVAGWERSEPGWPRSVEELAVKIGDAITKAAGASWHVVEVNSVVPGANPLTVIYTREGPAKEEAWLTD